MRDIHPAGRPLLAVLIATRNRPQLLERALESVRSQTRLPDVLVLVDDARPGEASIDAIKISHWSEQQNVEVILLRNRRYPGAAGAWNSGLDELHRRAGDPTRVFVAVLDDDDQWYPNHLEACCSHVCDRNLDMVVSGIIRFDESNPSGTKHSLPDRLDADELLAVGQHIQGSNLFVRLDKLLKAGLFSEELPSCTDRDLCLKLEELGDVRFGNTGIQTVRHNADSRADRCSTPGSPQKLEGLTRFWEKWRHQMSPEVEARFIERATKLFGWNCPVVAEAKQAHAADVTIQSGERETLQVVVATTTESRCPDKIRPLLNWLLEWKSDPGITSLRVVVVENGPRRADGDQPLRREIDTFRQKGLPCYYIDHERQREDAEFGLLGIPPCQIGQRLPIAITRTMAAVYAGTLAKKNAGTGVWMVDDEYRPYAIRDMGDSSFGNLPCPDISELLRAKRSGVDIVIGQLTGSASLPFLSTVRTQLLDLKFLLHSFDRLSPESLLPDCSVENRRLRQKFDDYYYDFARADSGHLESPMRLEPAQANESCADACDRIAGLICQIPFGIQVFRHCLLREDNDTEGQSLLRGGSAFFFNPDHVLAIPNLISRLDGIYTRRSDMVATIIAKETLGLNGVKSACIAGYHDRSAVETGGNADFDTLIRDVRGYALYSTLRELFEERRKGTFGGESGQDLAFSMAEMEWSRERFHKLLTERKQAISLSFHRIIGLTEALRRLLLEAEERKTWWTLHIGFREHLQSLCEWLDRQFNCERIPWFMAEVSKATEQDWCCFLRNLERELKTFQKDLSQHSFAVDAWLNEQRRQIAESRLRSWLRLAPLRFLGQGAEGVVFSDGIKCYKLIDSRKSSEENGAWGFLKGLVNRWKNTKMLYPIEAVHEDAGQVILIYPYEPGQHYCGGHGSELIQLLKECRDNGIVCRNLHPKNLIVASCGLRLVDYGSDIVLWSEEEFLMMAKRAWLTWRWHHRPDLAEIMRRALVQSDMPELVGFDRFFSAVEDRRVVHELHQFLAKEIGSDRPTTILDYGCGKGKLAARLAEDGLTVEAYDPDKSLSAYWSRLSTKWSNLKFSHALPDDRTRFDVVVSSLVLCQIPDGAEYQRVIRDLRSFLKPGGVLLVAVCNPFFTFGGPTPLHVARHVPLDARYAERFSFMESISRGVGPRSDTHRPLRRFIRDLSQAGLLMDRMNQTTTVDLERFEPASDFLVLKLRPVQPASKRVSLMIKACAMEARTIEAQVRYLVSQLERPTCFHERILVVDSKEDGFLGQYTTPDHSSLGEACQRLLDDDWVDRIVHASAEPDSVRTLYQRWFGLDATGTHAANGAQLASVLQGWEECSGEYILHLDSDVMVCRRDPRHNYLEEMIEVLESDPAGLTVALNIAHEEDRPYTTGNSQGRWRVESRAGLMHKQRLFANRPYANSVSDGSPQLPWYRSMDLAMQSGRMNSYRGGDRRTFFIHPPNGFKQDVDSWMLRLDFVERGMIPAIQHDHVDLVGSGLEWLLPQRFEPFVFVICGRNVPPGRFWRCLDSVLIQRHGEWGAIVVDDNSDEQSSAFIEMLCEPHADRITLVRPRSQRGLLANLVLAIRHLCGNPESVILTLDADDALLGPCVLDRVAREYLNGADATVGSMLRTDKHRHYPVDLVSPRSSRGGNVWQHLRTFKKHLFDRIRDEDMRLDGEYVKVATDWAFMVPIVEMARKPVHIPDPLYLYEPFGVGKGEEQSKRESIIGRLLAKPSYKGCLVSQKCQASKIIDS